jgi:1,2-diacylglycerol 3-beta-galactosyltransferase
MKKITILMVTGGGGHGAGARAISGALDHLYGHEVSTSIVDVSKTGGRSPVGWLDGLYRWLASDGLWLWKLLWWTYDRPWVTRLGARLLTPVFGGWLGRILSAEAPDLVVTVHGFVNHIPQRVLRKKRPHVPFVTVVLDLVSAHPVWFCPEADLCLVATEATRERALRLGVPPEKVEIVGLPVDLRFTAPTGDKAALRARLQLDPSRPCVLVVGGGDGVGALYETAHALASGLRNIQLVVVAGRNESLRRRLEQSTWEAPTQVYGFVQNMPELMAASDLLVTKAGSVTLAEAFVMGLPVIIYGFVPGQEEGNIGWVQERGAGAYSADPQEVAAIARAWLQPGNQDLARVTANARALARPEASLTIARRLYALLQGY